MVRTSPLSLAGMPDLLQLHNAHPERYPYLLQTLGEPGIDILFAFPQETILYTLADLYNPTRSFCRLLDEQWQRHQAKQLEQGYDMVPPLLPFTGGWFLYLGYELLHELEPTVPLTLQGTDVPLACLSRIPAAILVDKQRRETYLIAEKGYLSCLSDMEHDLEHLSATAPSAKPVIVKDLVEEDEMLFLSGVERIKRYIAAGDVFQVNLARQWQATLSPEGSASATAASSVYARLRETNPAPFAGLASLGHHHIISSSPERLVRVSTPHGTRRDYPKPPIIETRPIAGTYPRSFSASEDDRVKLALKCDPKEQSEHIMLIDLERNDLGRICLPGSVEVNELMAVSSYAYVHHIESNIRGHIRPGITPGEVIRAVFPGGTITGCPKVRTMQIIHELEATPRLGYTGSMGYLNHDGSLDLNILIRSFLLDQHTLYWKAGAGIVADSIPERELAETRAKAHGLRVVLQTEGP